MGKLFSYIRTWAFLYYHWLRFTQTLQMVSGHFFVKKIYWNRAWHVIYGWKELLAGGMFGYSTQCKKYSDIDRYMCMTKQCSVMPLHLYFKNIDIKIWKKEKTVFFPTEFSTISIFKKRDGCVLNSIVSSYMQCKKYKI